MKKPLKNGNSFCSGLWFVQNIYKKKELLQSAGNKTVFGPVANELLQRNFRRKYFKFISIYIKKFI